MKRFKRGDVLTAASLESMRTVAASLMNSDGDYRGPIAKRAVILDGSLSAAESALEPAWAMATVCVWDDSSKQYEQTEEEAKVWNHSESADFEADTFGFAETIDGHDVFFGDCEPMEDRPPKPGAEE